MRNSKHLQEYRKKYREKNSERIYRLARERALIKKKELLVAYGGATCKHCGHSDVDVLEIDHVNHDGRAERANLKMYSNQFYAHLRKQQYPDKHRYQVLCRNCNWKKHINKLREKYNK